jgi:hypothetical protein
MLVAAGALAAAGCHSDLFKTPTWLSHQSDQPRETIVVPKSGGQPTELKADDVIRVMRHIGFPDQQILSLGPSLRDALRATGAAAFVRGRQVEAMLAINGDYLFIQATGQGSSIYDIKDKQFAAVPPMSAQSD